MYQQIPFKFEPRKSYTFDSYIAGSNDLVIELCSQCAEGEGEKQVYIWADTGFGKSHILQAACNLAAKHGHSSCYLPAAQLVEQGVQVLEGLEMLKLVCIDDVHCLLDSSDWELALFNFINRCRESGAALIISSQFAPEKLDIKLPDLHSRLLWGPVIKLQSLDDSEKFEALRQRALSNGLELPQNVADYLMRHYPRDLFGLFERLEQLDSASMALQRKLTVPFVKSVLG